MMSSVIQVLVIRSMMTAGIRAALDCVVPRREKMLLRWTPGARVRRASMPGAVKLWARGCMRTKKLWSESCMRDQEAMV